jgi:O-antigen ligase
VRALYCSGLIAIYVLAGRWGFQRLGGPEILDLDYLPLEASLGSPLQLRFLTTALFLLLLILGRRQAAAPTRMRRYLYACNLYFCYLILSVLWTPDSSFGLVKAAEVLMVMVCSGAIYRVMTGPLGPAVLRRTWALMFGLTGVMAVLALVKAAQYGPERLAVLGGGPNVFGRMMGLFCLGGLYFWRRTGRWAYIGAAVLGFLLIILSGSRGGLIAMALAALVFFAVERIRVTRLMGIALGAGVALTLVCTFTPVGRQAVDTYEERVNRLLIQEGYVSGRSELYQLAWEMAKEYPLAGGGLCAFRGLRYGVYPHNIFLETLCEEGAIGVLLLLLVFWQFERVYWHNRRHADGATIGAFVLSLVGMQFSGDFFDGRTVFVFMTMALIPVASRGETPS